MKKLIVLLVMFFITLGVYSTEQTKESLNDSTIIAQVNPTVVYFTEKLEELAKSLKVPAEHVYEILVKQQLVSSIVDLILFLIGIVSLVSCFIIAFNKNTDWDEPGLRPISSIILGLISLILIIYGIMSVNSIISGLVNPEYGALKEIMSLF